MNFSQTYHIRRTTIMMVGFAAFLLGLGAARSGADIDSTWAIFSLILVITAYKTSRLALVCSVLLLGLSLGWWRGSAYLQDLNKYNAYYDQTVILSGVAETDAVYANKSQLSFDVGKLKIEEPEQVELVGKIKVEGLGTPAVFRGDMVRMEGKLRSTIGSRQGRMSFAKLEVLGRSGSVIENIRHRFVAGMLSALPEPHGSFGLGLLIGQRNTLPENVTEQLSIVGLTHLIAVSGYNLTILVRGTRRLLGKRSKYQSFIFSLSLVGLFLLFTGFSASIVRAAIVSLLSLLAWYYGRAFRPVLLLLISAALTAGWYPIYIWSDIGWYLSFLAFFGVLVLAPLLVKRFYRPHKQPKALSMIVIESLCAQLMTLPLIMYIFSEVSLVAVLANVLVVWMVPFAMLSSLAAGLAGMLMPFIAGWFAWPGRLLLTYMLDTVSLLARIPHALAHRSLGLWPMLFLYGVIVGISLVLGQKTKSKNVILTDEITQEGS